MLTVVDDARVRAGDGHAAWSESFNEMYAQVAGAFGNAAVRRHGRAYLLGLLSHTAGVARMYTGTAGRVENCQVGVFLAYAAPDGSRALIDRKLYLPEKWAADRPRCRQAGIGDEVPFATRPKLAQDMIERAAAAGVPFAWVAADLVYGQNPGGAEWLEDHETGYVMAVPCSEMMIAAGRKRRADELAALVPGQAWQQLSCADGSKCSTTRPQGRSTSPDEGDTHRTTLTGICATGSGRGDGQGRLPGDQQPGGSSPAGA